MRIWTVAEKLGGLAARSTREEICSVPPLHTNGNRPEFRAVRVNANFNICGAHRISLVVIFSTLMCPRGDQFTGTRWRWVRRLRWARRKSRSIPRPLRPSAYRYRVPTRSFPKFTCGCSMSGTLRVPLMSEAFARSATIAHPACRLQAGTGPKRNAIGALQPPSASVTPESFESACQSRKSHRADDEVVHRHVDSLDVHGRLDLASNDRFQRHFRAGQQ